MTINLPYLNLVLQYPDLHPISNQEERDRTSTKVTKALDYETVTQTQSEPDYDMSLQESSSCTEFSFPSDFLQMLFIILIELSNYRDGTIELPPLDDAKTFCDWYQKKGDTNIPDKDSCNQFGISRQRKKQQKEGKLSQEMQKNLCRKTFETSSQSWKGRQNGDKKRINHKMKENAKRFAYRYLI